MRGRAGGDLVISAATTDSAGPNPARVTLASGSVLQVRRAARSGKSWQFETAGERVVASAAAVRRIKADESDDRVGAKSVLYRIAGAAPVNAIKCTLSGTYAILEKADQSRIVVDRRVLDPSCE